MGVQRVLRPSLRDVAPPTPPTDPRHGQGRRHELVGGLSDLTFGLKPHLVETFKLSPDPLVVEKIHVGGLYINPPEGALVLCVD